MGSSSANARLKGRGRARRQQPRRQGPPLPDLSLYDHPPARQACRVWDDGKWKLVHRTLDRLCTYPPLSAYLLWGSGKVFVAVSDDRIINTTTSRAVFASWVIVGDFVLALG